MRRLVLVVSLLLGSLSSSASAQDEPAPDPPAQSAAEVLERLASNDPREVAWGARFAGQLRLPEATPRLLEILEGRAKVVYDADDQARHVQNHVLDALIRLDARLPADSPAFEEMGFRRAVAMIFMSRDPQPHAATLVRAFAKDTDGRLGPEQTAAGNLLAVAPAPGFVAALLRRLPLTLAIRVRDPGSGGRARIVGYRNLRGGHGSSIARIPAGFPPVVYYDFAFERRAGSESDAILIARGVQSVYAVRREVEEGRICCSPSLTRQAVPLCEAWLSQVLVGEPGGFRFSRRRSMSIDWTDAESYLRDATAVHGGFIDETRD